MTKKQSVADFFELDDVCEDGLYLVGYEGEMPQSTFPFREWSRWLKENGVTEITRDTLVQAQKDGVLTDIQKCLWMIGTKVNRQ